MDKDEMDEIECLVCDKALNIPKWITRENYKGSLRCRNCRALLHVRFMKRNLIEYKIIEGKPQQLPYNVLMRKLMESEEQKKNE